METTLSLEMMEQINSVLKRSCVILVHSIYSRKMCRQVLTFMVNTKMFRHIGK